jgi:hypothetical protein
VKPSEIEGRRGLRALPSAAFSKPSRRRGHATQTLVRCGRLLHVVSDADHPSRNYQACCDCMAMLSPRAQRMSSGGRVLLSTTAQIVSPRQLRSHVAKRAACAKRRVDQSFCASSSSSPPVIRPVRGIMHPSVASASRYLNFCRQLYAPASGFAAPWADMCKCVLLHAIRLHWGTCHLENMGTCRPMPPAR